MTHQLTPRQRDLLRLALAAGYCVRLPDGAPPNLMWTAATSAAPRSFADRTGDTLWQEGLLAPESTAGSLRRFAPTAAARELAAHWRWHPGRIAPAQATVRSAARTVPPEARSRHVAHRSRPGRDT